MDSQDCGWPARLGGKVLGVFWRPIPLYQTVAVAAAAAVLVGFLGLRSPGSAEAPPARTTSAPAPTVDFTGTRPVGQDVL